MPTYEYQCLSCGATLEVTQKITEDALTQCPACKSESLRRGPGGGIGLQFKGSGFYCTDYNQKPSNPPESSSPGCACGKSGPCSS